MLLSHVFLIGKEINEKVILEYDQRQGRISGLVGIGDQCMKHQELLISPFMQTFCNKKRIAISHPPTVRGRAVQLPA